MQIDIEGFLYPKINITVTDYFHDHSLYINADWFNDKGREVFAKIFIDDLKN